MRSGSRNCGPCTEAGVRTEIVLTGSGRVKVWINGKRSMAPTSVWVARKLLPGGLGAKIRHTSDVPVGAGFGASGAGALGVALALGSILGLGRRDAVAAAHQAEIVCRTGLGDVCAQAAGGLVIGVRPGAPPYGTVRRIRVRRDVEVVCCTLGGIRTSSALARGELVSRAKRIGGKAMREILASPRLESFLRVSRWFAEELGLMDAELREMCEIAERAGAIGASQAMLGRTVFAVCGPDKSRRVAGALAEVGGRVILTRISAEGGRLLHAQ